MFSNRIILTQTILSLFISQLIFWMVYLNFEQFPPVIPFWHLNAWGESQLVERAYAWLLPGLAAGILAFDLVFVTFTHRKWKFLSGFLMGTATIFNLFLLLTTFNLLYNTLGWS